MKHHYKYERKIRIDVAEKVVFIDLCYFGTDIIYMNLFTFRAGTNVTCLSFDEEEKRWMKTSVVWAGPAKHWLDKPSEIQIICVDNESFKWIASLKEFLNKSYFTTEN